MTLTNVTVTDPLTCRDGSSTAADRDLAPGASDGVHRTSYAVTQADIDSNGGFDDGDIDNTAEDGSGPNGRDRSVDDSEECCRQSPRLSIDKTVR